MATWYKAQSYGLKVEPVEVVKETERTVTVLERGRERRTNKVSQLERYFSTEAEVGAYLIQREQAVLKTASTDIAMQLRAQQARSALGELRRRYPDAPEWNT